VEAGKFYEVSIATSGQARILAGGQVVLEQTGSEQIRRDMIMPLEEVRVVLPVLPAAPGAAIDLVVEWIPDRMRGMIQVGCRARDFKDGEELAQRALRAAAGVDAVVVVAGTDEWSEREGMDLPFGMELRGQESEFIRRLCSANPRTVVCLNCGSPKNITSFVDIAGAVLAAWFPGQEGANAIASVLVDGASEWGPCGRLPTTWPRALADCPVGVPQGAHYPGENNRVFYSEGTNRGDRWFEARGNIPLYPFGHGLSYTNFAFRDLKLIPGQEVPAGKDLEVHVTVKNIGMRPGKEVAQVYVSRRRTRGGSTVRGLAGFVKAALRPGEEKTLTVRVDLAEFTAKGPTAPGQEFDVFVGPSCTDLQLQQRVRVR
jgi:beta-glucosidase